MSDRPHSLLVDHVMRHDTHGWIATGPGCLACTELHGPDYTGRAQSAPPQIREEIGPR